MDTAVSTIFDAASKLRSLLIQGLSASTGSDVPIAIVAQNLLDVVVGQLNTKDNGRYIFAGSKTNTEPVPSPVPDPAVFGTPDTTYYQGNSVAMGTSLPVEALGADGYCGLDHLRRRQHGSGKHCS